MRTFPMEIRDGEVVCSKCGGSVMCSGTVELSSVPVFLDGGEMTHDWADAGSGSFEPEEYHCSGCGTILIDPGNLGERQE